MECKERGEVEVPGWRVRVAVELWVERGWLFAGRRRGGAARSAVFAFAGGLCRSEARGCLEGLRRVVAVSVEGGGTDEVDEEVFEAFCVVRVDAK